MMCAPPTRPPKKNYTNAAAVSAGTLSGRLARRTKKVLQNPVKGKGSRGRQGFRPEETGTTRGTWSAVLKLSLSARAIDSWPRLNFANQVALNFFNNFLARYLPAQVRKASAGTVVWRETLWPGSLV